MTLAAVAGAAFFAGHILAISLTDFKAALIDFSDQMLIISEYAQFPLPFFTDFDKTGPDNYKQVSSTIKMKWPISFSIPTFQRSIIPLFHFRDKFESPKNLYGISR